MSIENPLWGAPRIHGELLKLGFEVAQSTVANTWPSDRDRQVRDGALFCVTTRQTLLPWTCSLSRVLVSTCSIPSSSSGWTGDSSSGSTLHSIQRPNGSHAS